MTAPAPARRARVRPGIRRFAILALVVLTPIAAHAIWDHLELRRLIREIENIQARGEPVTRVGVEGGYRPLTADERLASAYSLAAGTLAFGYAWPADDLRPVRDWLAGATGPPEPLEALARDLAARAAQQRDVLALADTAAALPFRSFAAGTESSYRAQGLAQASQTIAARTVHLSLAGDGDAAAASAITALAFRRAARDVLFLLRGGGHEVAAVLSLSHPSADALIRLQQALAAEDEPTRDVRDLFRARASHIEPIWLRYYGTDAGAPRAYLLPRRSFAETALRPWLTRELVATLRVWREVIDAAQTPWPARRAAAESVRTRYADAAESSWRLPPPLHTLPLGPAFPIEHLRRAVLPGQLIEDRSARVAIAIERYRRNNGDSLPDALTDLVGTYFPAIPIDPFTGAPLLYRADAGAYVVYSVGDDLTDDGGRLLQPSPRGSASPYVSGPDLGVRILLRQRLDRGR